MHILITDSGVGGLSVCAYAERFVRMHGFKESVRLTFANAAPENDYGYNSMPSTRTVDVHVAWLRQKIEPNPRHPQYILTVHGMGYKFAG